MLIILIVLIDSEYEMIETTRVLGYVLESPVVEAEWWIGTARAI